MHTSERLSVIRILLEQAHLNVAQAGALWGGRVKQSVGRE